MKQEYQLIIDSSSIETEKWEQFVKDHVYGNIFHTSDLVSVYEQTGYYQPLTFFLVDKNSSIKAILIGYLLKESGLKSYFSRRLIIWGGPLIQSNNDNAIIEFFSGFSSITKHNVIYSQFRNLNDFSIFDSIFKKYGYQFEDHLDIIFDLSQSSEKLWNDIHPTRRKQIKRGYRRGVEVAVFENYRKEIVSECARLIIMLYEKTGLPCPKEDFFHIASINLMKKGRLKLFIAQCNNLIIGCRFVLCYKELIYDWYAASDPNQLDKYPNDILPWEIIRWGNQNNYQTFDFGGAGKPNKPYGVRDYKQKFGGSLVNYGRYEKVHRPLLMLIGKFGFTVMKVLKIKL